MSIARWTLPFIRDQRLFLLALTALSAGFPAAARAQDASDTPSDATASSTTEDLAKLKQNPVSGLRQLLFTANVNPQVPGSDDSMRLYSTQLVWPIRINDDWRVVTYSILPYARLPAPPGQAPVSGLGNTLLNFYFSPTHADGNLVWGAGPAVLLPTRTRAELGTDRTGLGPSGLLYYARDAWSAGVVLQNIWSLGGSGRNKVNTFGAQYILNYNLDKGWYLFSNQTITADWTAESSNRWTVPVAAGAGRIFNIGKQPVSASLQLFSNVVRPDGAARWGWNVQFGFLFP